MKLRRKLLAGFLCLAIVGLAGCSQKADDKRKLTTLQQLNNLKQKKTRKKKRRQMTKSTEFL